MVSKYDLGIKPESAYRLLNVGLGDFFVGNPKKFLPIPILTAGTFTVFNYTTSTLWTFALPCRMNGCSVQPFET